jgi:hypothetical protein
VIVKTPEFVNPTAINIEADSQRADLAECYRDGQSHVTKADDPDLATKTLQIHKNIPPITANLELSSGNIGSVFGSQGWFQPKGWKPNVRVLILRDAARLRSRRRPFAGKLYVPDLKGEARHYVRARLVGALNERPCETLQFEDLAPVLRRPVEPADVKRTSSFLSF